MKRTKPRAFIVASLDPRRNAKGFLAQEADKRLYELLTFGDTPKQSSDALRKQHRHEDKAKHAPNKWGKLRACQDIQGALKAINAPKLSMI